MKILHVITTLDVGGAEMHLLAQVRGQRARGHEPSVAFLKGHGTLAQDFAAAGASRVERLPLGPGFPLRLARLARGTDIVHTHLLKADMAVALCAGSAQARAQLISSKHNDEQVLRRSLVGRIHGWLGNRPARTIALSDHVAGFVERYGRVRREKLVRIYYGLDPAPFEAARAAAAALKNALRASLGFGPQDVVFTCVARFAPQKAHHVLLRALALAREREPRLALLLVGDDPFGEGRVRAEALAAELRLGPRCVFAGIRRDVPALLAASEGFVMSSLWEGLGLVFLEAMATGLPVVASGVSAVPEVVLDGETGLLVPPSDPEALSRALCELARDPERRARMGAAGVRRVRAAFGLERMVEETLAVYRSVAPGHDERRPA
ncbi:MAG: glycosyltransferase family 4 protein [Planctomycetes bacterium]|nr:glycosyltransferase family 4 protein [Planctomycetota bacterium]